MPEEPEVETSELQETIDELHKERSEREAEEKATKWTKLISLSTALLAVFAAVGALQSGDLVNEAMISQLKASDFWNEYQSDKQKVHIYTIAANTLNDTPPPALGNPNRTVEDKWSPKDPISRAADYEDQVKKEGSKTKELGDKATKLEKESEEMMKAHHSFARSVAFIQVAIALGAISALTKIKPVWYMSLVVGLAGIAFFAVGFGMRGI